MTPWQPSGRVAWLRFLPLVALAAAAATMLAHLAWRLDARGANVPVLAAWAFAALAGIAAAFAVRQGHCRNPWLGGAVGLLLALTAFLGRFEFALLELGGDPRALPQYLVLRMRQARAPGDAPRQAAPVAAPLDRPAGEGMAPREAWRWAAFGVELLGVSVIGWSLGWLAAGQPYSESRRRWLVTELRSGGRGFGRAALAALHGRAESPTELPGPAVVAAEFVPPLADSPDVALTIRDWAEDYDPAPRWLLRRQRLDDAERARFAVWWAAAGK